MALYAFDGTGDAWDQKSPITPTAKTNNDRYLTNVVFFYKEYVESGLRGEYFPGVGSSTLEEVMAMWGVMHSSGMALPIVPGPT